MILQGLDTRFWSHKNRHYHDSWHSLLKILPKSSSHTPNLAFLALGVFVQSDQTFQAPAAAWSLCCLRNTMPSWHPRSWRGWTPGSARPASRFSRTGSCGRAGCHRVFWHRLTGLETVFLEKVPWECGRRRKALRPVRRSSQGSCGWFTDKKQR